MTYQSLPAQIMDAVANAYYVLLELRYGERRTIEGRLSGLNLWDRTVLLASFDGDRDIPIRDITKVTVFGGQR